MQYLGPLLSDLRLCPSRGRRRGLSSPRHRAQGHPSGTTGVPRWDYLLPPGTLGCARTEALCTLPLSLMMRPIS